MYTFDHTTNWIKGELFESKLIIAFSIVSFIFGLLFFKFGETDRAKALFIPILTIGLVYSLVGASMCVTNQKRIVNFEKEYKLDTHSFVKKEKQRIESFQYQYTISKVVATVGFLSTLLIFWLTNNSSWQGVGIGISLFSLAGLIIDYFSEERARIYYQEILNLLQ